MKLLRHIRIENFRSIARLDLRDLDHATPFVGTNGAGKSNILRALNLFFNGEVEPGVPLELQRDFHKPRSNKRKAVTVGVQFDFPPDFHIHSSVRSAASAVGIQVPTPQSIAVQRTWTIDAATRSTAITLQVGTSLDDLHIPDLEEARIIQILLSLIRFRYIPNHVHPSEILAAERDSLRKELMSRLKKRKAYQRYQRESGKPLFSELAQVAKDLLHPITAGLVSGSAVVREVQIDTPGEFSELLWEIALSLETPSGDTFGTLLQGSGTQAHLMYLVLDLIDNSYGTSFGWRQATIWAFEEPESFLHTGLQGRVATSLRTAAERPRLQVLATTHNPVFMAIGTVGVLVDTTAGASTAELLPTRELIERGFAGDVSPWVHPLVGGVPMPLLLLEGTTDVDYIKAAYESIGRTIPWDIHCLPTLDRTIESGGTEQIIRYLRTNEQAIAARPHQSPIYVLLDWDAESKLGKYQEALACHPSSRAVVMPKALANPELGESFRGIERFLSTGFWEEALAVLNVHQPPVPVTPRSILPQELSRIKSDLLPLLASRGQAADLNYLCRVVQWLDEGAGPVAVPVSPPAAA